MTLLWPRRLLLVLCVFILGGSLGASLGYAYYLNSPSYRMHRTAELTDATGLHAEIGRVKPLSFHSRSFGDVRLTLPTDGTEVFSCQEAIWRESAESDDSRTRLDLRGGRLLLGTDRWRTSDYERMLRSGLGHDFESLGLSEVRFSEMDLDWLHERFRLSFGGATGQVSFGKERSAEAKITACALNEEALSEPLSVNASLTTGTSLVFNEVSLMVPRLSLHALGVDQVMQTEIRHGMFQGRITYRRRREGDAFEATGRLEDAHLPELTGAIIGGPFSGQADLTVDELIWADESLQALRCHGKISGIQAGELLPWLDASGGGGNMELRVHQADWRDDRIRYLSLSGRADDLPLDTLTKSLGYGDINGRLRVNIKELNVIDELLVSGEVELVAEPFEGEPGTIESRLIAYVSREVLGVDVSAVLPERIPYSRLGVRLVLNQGRLYVRGTHGPQGKTILTVRLFNRDWGVLNESDRSFEVPDLVALLRSQISGQSPNEFRQWWEQQHPEP